MYLYHFQGGEVMRDVVKGRVMRVKDKETVELAIVRISGSVSGPYASLETVRLMKVKPIIPPWEEKGDRKELLSRFLLGKEVTCLVEERTSEGYLKGDLFLL